MTTIMSFLNNILLLQDEEVRKRHDQNQKPKLAAQI